MIAARSTLALAVMALLAVSALAQDAKMPAPEPKKQVPEKAAKQNGGDSGPGSWQFWEPAKANEAGQRKQGGDSGPDSWQFWSPSRQLLATGTQQPNTKKSVNEAGQRVQGGDAGPNSWQFWKPSRQLLATGTQQPKKSVNEAGQRVQGGDAGPNSWQFWKPARQLLAEPVKKPVAAAAPAKKVEAGKPQAVPAAKPAAALTKKDKAGKPQAKPAAVPAAKSEAAPKQGEKAAEPAKKSENERGFGARSTGWGGWWSGGTAYPLQNGNTIFTTAGWGGEKPLCAGAGLANSCASGKKKH